MQFSAELHTQRHIKANDVFIIESFGSSNFCSFPFFLLRKMFQEHTNIYFGLIVVRLRVPDKTHIEMDRKISVTFVIQRIKTK